MQVKWTDEWSLWPTPGRCKISWLRTQVVTGKTLPLGGCEPGRRSMAQSLERWGGNWEALVLLKASMWSWYSPGILDALQGSGCLPWRMRLRQFFRQNSDHWIICLSDQEIHGLCFSNQGRAKMRGVWGDWKTKRRMVSVWRALVRSDKSSVVNWIRPEPEAFHLTLPLPDEIHRE